MTGVTIDRELLSTSPLGETPRERWPEIMEMRFMFCRRCLTGNCRHLVDFVEDGRLCDFAGYADEEAYIREGLGIDPALVRWAMDGLRLLGAEIPASAEAPPKGEGAEPWARARQEYPKARATIDAVRKRLADDVAHWQDEDWQGFAEEVCYWDYCKPDPSAAPYLDGLIPARRRALASELSPLAHDVKAYVHGVCYWFNIATDRTLMKIRPTPSGRAREIIEGLVRDKLRVLE